MNSLRTPFLSQFKSIGFQVVRDPWSKLVSTHFNILPAVSYPQFVGNNYPGGMQYVVFEIGKTLAYGTTFTLTTAPKWYKKSL